MTETLQIYAPTLLRALVVSGILAWPIYLGLVALKSRQTVSQHVAEHAHKQGTPTMGGLIVVVGLLACTLPLLIQEPFLSARMNGVPVLVITYALIGFVDDFVIPRLMKGKRGLGWIQKFAMQVGFAALSVLLMQPANTPALVFGVLSIIFFSNAYNFTDGLDWLSSTVGVALCLGLAALSYLSGVREAVYFEVAIIGGLVPFMVLNRPPAKLFMGDVGSMPIGGLIGLCMAATLWPATAPAMGMPSVHGWDVAVRPWPIWAAAAVLSFVMMAELFPPPLQIASVKLRKKRLFLMTPIHHAYQKKGWKETRIVAMFFTVQAVCALIAFLIAWKAMQP